MLSGISTVWSRWHGRLRVSAAPLSPVALSVSARKTGGRTSRNAEIQSFCGNSVQQQ